MAAMAITAWVWSGVAMMTASMSFSLSSITRKSLYRFASGYFSKTSAARVKSTSHRATMFSVCAALDVVLPHPADPHRPRC